MTKITGFLSASNITFEPYVDTNLYGAPIRNECQELKDKIKKILNCSQRLIEIANLVFEEEELKEWIENKS